MTGAGDLLFWRKGAMQNLLIPHRTLEHLISFSCAGDEPHSPPPSGRGVPYAFPPECGKQRKNHVLEFSHWKRFVLSYGHFFGSGPSG